MIIDSDRQEKNMRRVSWSFFDLVRKGRGSATPSGALVSAAGFSRYSGALIHTGVEPPASRYVPVNFLRIIHRHTYAHKHTHTHPHTHTPPSLPSCSPVIPFFSLPLQTPTFMAIPFPFVRVRWARDMATAPEPLEGRPPESSEPSAPANGSASPCAD